MKVLFGAFGYRGLKPNLADREPRREMASLQHSRSSTPLFHKG